MEPGGYPLPPGNGWPPAGNESYVVVRRLTLRSVDSEHVGRAIEPRNWTVRGSRRLSTYGRLYRHAALARRGGPAGVAERGMRALGFPRNLGDLVPSANNAGGAPADQLQALGRRARAQGSEPRCASRYCRAKETKRSGTSGKKSEILILPLKLGNSNRREPSGGKGVTGCGTVKGQEARDTEPGTPLHETLTGSCSG